MGAAIRLALGEQVRPEDLVPRYQRNICQRYIFPRPGRVERVTGVADAEKMPGVVFCQIRVKPGDIVGPVHSHPARAGLVMAMGESRSDAQAKTEAAIRAIQIETVPIEAPEAVGVNG